MSSYEIKPLVDGKNNPIPDDPYVKTSRIFYPLKQDPKEYKYIGKPCKRYDSHEIVTGAAVFTDDYHMSGLVYGTVVKSPYPHAIIKSINVEKAKAYPGVLTVLTYKDLDEMKMNPTLGWPPQKKMLDKHLRYVGDAVAIVGAETIDIALAAAELVEVEYEVLPAVYDTYSAEAEGAPQLYEQFPNNHVPGGIELMHKHGLYYHLYNGDADKAFKEKCKYISEDSVDFMGMCPPGAPEPPGVIVRWDGGMNYSVWATSQGCYFLKVVNECSIPGIKYTPYTFHTGGSYGNKQTLVMQVATATAIAYATNRPCKVFQTKVEQQTNFQTRLGTQVKAKIGLDEEGIIRAFRGVWNVDAGAFNDNLQANISVGMGECQLIMAKNKDWDLTSSIVVTNKQAAGVVRGFGGQELNSCLSMLLMRAAKSGNFDPVDVFAKNYAEDGDVYIWRDSLPWRVHSVKYDKMIRDTADKFGWKEKWKGWGVPTSVSDDGRYVTGVGMSVIGNADVGEDNCYAGVKLEPGLVDEQIEATLYVDISEIGNGQKFNNMKIVAEKFDIPLEQIKIVPSGTLYSPNGVALGGSRGTLTFGHAVSNACDDVLEQLFKRAEIPLGCSWQTMELKDNYVRSKFRPDIKVPLNDLIHYWGCLMGCGEHIEEFSTPSCVTAFVEVEVDTHTGKVRVKKMVVGTDPGQVMDPNILEMQVQGAIGSACLDTALFEEHIIDHETGRYMTYDMIEYKTRTFNEFPEFDHLFEESQWDCQPYHAIGIGEISGGGAASATMLAISNAIGKDVSTYPCTPGVILKELGKI